MSYTQFLELTQSELGLEHILPIEQLRHPATAAVASRGESLVSELKKNLGINAALGGSALLVAGRSALLIEEKPDIDIRVFVDSLDQFNSAGDFLRTHFALEKEEDRSSKEYLKGTGLPARAFVWSESIDGFPVSVEVQVRGSMVYQGIARQRLEKTTDQEFLLYLNIKAALKKGDRDTYNRFKKQENKFWDMPAKFDEAIKNIHSKTVKEEQRMGGESHSQHMFSVALKSLALGGGHLDYLTGALHDTLEENVSKDDWETIIANGLSLLLDAGESRDVIQRIKALTENPNHKKIPLPSSVELQLTNILDQLNVQDQKDRSYYAGYVAKYRGFLAQLIANKEQIRIVELADRWSGLESMEYLRKRGKIGQWISFGRIRATFDAMDAPAYLMKQLSECLSKWEATPAEIERSSALFWEGKHA